jgi:RNA polymerase sigma factor (TIGR02999 family)
MRKSVTPGTFPVGYTWRSYSAGKESTVMVREPAATGALIAHTTGDPDAASRLLPLVYDQLRALAAGYMRRERADHTLQPTGLVHEAYLRLVDGSRIDLQGKTHFFALAATQMRRVLADHARARNAAKRGGGARKVTLHDVAAIHPDGVVDMLALDEALHRLADESPRQVRVVELRFFGGLSVEATARFLGVSKSTVKGDWRVAKAWLARELSRG